MPDDPRPPLRADWVVVAKLILVHEQRSRLSGSSTVDDETGTFSSIGAS
jgi:hypothetical protein